MCAAVSLLNLPNVALEKIFSFLSYDEIARNRIVTLKIASADRVLILGQSKDYGTCKHKKNNGEPCSSFVNMNNSEFCIYHLKQAYQNCCKRSEFQLGSKGLTALRNKVLGKNEVFYAGKSYTAIPAKKNIKQAVKDDFRLQALTGNITTSPNPLIKNKKPNIKGRAVSIDAPANQRQNDLLQLQKLGWTPNTSKPVLIDSKQKDTETLQKLGVDSTATTEDGVAAEQPEYIDLNVDFKKTKKTTLNAAALTLLTGKKILPGTDTPKPCSSRFDKAKQQAISYVKKNGPLSKEDPNYRKNSENKKRPLEEQICRKFNQICSQMLTRGFYQMEKRHGAIYKKLKSLLPRRESERRNHPLARHCDILSAVETRISMLNMTFIKYIENSICCFIPGKILDEIDRILKLIESTGPAPRTHEFLQELRDISSMAMEHFDEQILPTLKSHIDPPPVLPVGESSSSRQPLLIVNKLVTDEMRKIRKQNKSNKQITILMQQQIVKLFQKIKTQNSRIKAQTNKLKEQERKIQEQTVKIKDAETVVGEMKRHIDEWEQKFSDLTAELVRAREDLTAKSRLSPVPPSPRPISASVPISRPFVGHILPRTGLPRTPTILLHNTDRKRKSPEGVETPPCKLPKNISKDICNKISKNITNNISKNITDSMMKDKDSNAGKKESSFSFLSSSLETLLKRPLTSLTGRKRKIQNDIELK